MNDGDYLVLKRLLEDIERRIERVELSILTKEEIRQRDEKLNDLPSRHC